MYFVGRGKLFVADRALSTDPDQDGFSSVSAGARWIGNASEFKITPTTTREGVTEFYSGQDARDFTMQSEFNLKVSITAEEAGGLANMALALGGSLRTFQGESVSGQNFYVKGTDGKFAEYKGTAALPTGKNAYMVQEVLNGGLKIDQYNYFTDLVITDSSSTVKTLVLNTHYTVNTVNGAVVFKAFPAGVTFPLKGAFDLNLIVDRFAGPVYAGTWYFLSRQNLETLVLKDSSSSPQVVDSDIYDVDYDAGMFKFKSKVSLEALDLVYPLKAEMSYGKTVQVTIGTVLNQEKWLRFVGVNTATDQKVTADLYRVSFDPAELSLIMKGTSKLPLTGECLNDPTKPVDGPMGQIGRIVMNG